MLPIGSIEQHAYLSLAVDTILAERVAVEAAEPLGIPVFPVGQLRRDAELRRLSRHGDPAGSRRCARSSATFSTGSCAPASAASWSSTATAATSPAHGAVLEWLDRNRGCQVKWHNWWKAPQTWAKVKEIDPVASHASWMENFPWTRLAGVAMPAGQKPMMDIAPLRRLDPVAKKAVLGDGNYGGLYQRRDDDMLALWEVAVEETRAVIARAGLRR